MNKKLAIKGHPTRGKEVIELLEMLGGCSPIEAYKLYKNRCYLINDKGWIVWDYIGPEEIDKYIIFTLEEFLEKYPFKVGDKVEVCETGKVFTIGNMIWEDEFYTVHYCNMEDIEYYTAKELKPYKEGSNMKDNEDKLFDSIIWHLRNSVNNGKQNLSGGECEDYFREVVKKNNENKMKSVLAELLEHIKTTPKEELEREFEEIKDWSNVGPSVEEFNAFCESVNKKPVYPKTFEECCKILFGNESYSEFTFIPAKVCKSYYKGDFITELPFEIIPYETKIRMLYKLLVCRDAYWKIAGEEMGLGKPWKPDWNDLNRKYFISLTCDGIGLYDDFRNPQVLVFPTAEMRDAFYENFKDLIEQCKELL